MADTSSTGQPVTLEDLSVRQRLLYAGYEAAAFTVTRYPYLCAVLMMVTLPEEMRGRKKLDLDYFSPSIVNLGIYFLTATVMSFDLFRLKRLFALICAAHLGFVSFQEYSYSMQREVILSRMLCRNLANIGVYLSVAGGISHGQRGVERNKTLLGFGRQMIGAYAFLNAAIIYNSQEEFSSFVKLWPFGIVGPYFVIACYIICCLCLYGGFKVVLMSKALAWLLLIVTVTVDANSSFWMRETGVKYWMCMTIACRNIPVIAILILSRKGYT